MEVKSDSGAVYLTKYILDKGLGTGMGLLLAARYGQPLPLFFDSLRVEESPN